MTEYQPYIAVPSRRFDMRSFGQEAEKRHKPAATATHSDGPHIVMRLGNPLVFLLPLWKISPLRIMESLLVRSHSSETTFRSNFSKLIRFAFVNVENVISLQGGVPVERHSLLVEADKV